MYACGVRKSWIKELQGLDTPSRKIAHLRSILSDLGMKGRFSMEQAKVIKEKREFAKEMGSLTYKSKIFIAVLDVDLTQRMFVSLPRSSLEMNSRKGTRKRRLQ